MNPVLSLIIIIININTINGIPDFNLFPFEIDEDLLFALGYHRWHQNNHGKTRYIIVWRGVHHFCILYSLDFFYFFLFL